MWATLQKTQTDAYLSSEMSDIIKTTSNTPLSEQLAAFGLNNAEARMYLYLVGKPPRTVLDIAQALHLPRTTVYDCAVKLSEKGLIQKIIKHKSQQLQAYPLSILQTYIDKEKSRVDDLQVKLEVLEQTIKQSEQASPSTEVRYYHGSKGLQQMMWNTLKAEGDLIGYAQFGLMEVVGRPFIERYASELLRRNIHSRVITNHEYLKGWKFSHEPFATYRNTLQQGRVVESGKLHISGDTTMYNNVFAVAHWQHGEIVGVEIENAEIVKTQRSMFDWMWDRADNIEG